MPKLTGRRKMTGLWKNSAIESGKLSLTEKPSLTGRVKVKPRSWPSLTGKPKSLVKHSMKGTSTGRPKYHLRGLMNRLRLRDTRLHRSGAVHQLLEPFRRL